MPRKSLVVLLPFTLALALVARRLVPGPGPGGETVLPSGWRIRPAGRSVPVGTLPLNVIPLADGSLAVTNDGYGDNGLVGIDPGAAETRWEVPLAGAWLGLASAGDTLWAGAGGPTASTGSCAPAAAGTRTVSHSPQTAHGSFRLASHSSPDAESSR